MTHRRRKALIAGAVLVGALAVAAPVLAVWDPTLPVTPRSGVPSEVTLSGVGPGGGVTGFIGPVGSTSDPTATYPTAIPAGFTPLNEAFAGIIFTVGPGGTPTLQMYCINILTPTNVGFGYNLGTWNEANVTNVGFVARVLNDYYPHTPAEPAAATTNATKAAAVQAAIWYFADNYVLALSDPLRPVVESIVNTVRGLGPLPEPTQPPLNITPSTLTVDAGSDAGLFTITTGLTGAVISATGATMVAADGATVIANGTNVANGTQIFLRSATPGSATLTAASVEAVARSHVYLYTGNTTAPAGQKLILAESQTVRTTATAGVTFSQTTTTTSTTTTTTSTTTTTTTTTAPTTTTTEPTTTTTEPTTTTPTTAPTTTPTTDPTTTAASAVAPAATGTLPHTGSDSEPPAVVAAGLMAVAGIALVVLGRRRLHA